MKQGNSVWHRIQTSSPINRLARSVIGGGAHFEYKRNKASRDQNRPYHVRPIRFCEEFSSAHVDFTGQRKGRLVVLGMSDIKGGGDHRTQRGRWVCRCDCGMYTLRKAAALKKTTIHMCDECSHLEQLKGKQTWR